MPRFALVLALCAFGLSTVRAEDSPLVATIKKTVKDPTKPFGLHVTATVKKDKAEAFEAAFAEAIAATRKEKGCLTYELHRDAENPETFVLWERWSSLEALEAHMKTDHIAKLFKSIGETLDGEIKAKVMLVAGEKK